MTVYNINLGIGWASSGVEYAQVYRSKLFKAIGQEAKFIFTDMILTDNIQHLTANIGFSDDQVIWLYNHFTDLKIAPSTVPLQQILKQIEGKPSKITRDGKMVRYTFDNEQDQIVCHLADSQANTVQAVDYIYNGLLVRKDYYSYTKYCSEFYAPSQNQAKLYQRTFYNEDGSIAYDMVMAQEGQEIYRLPNQVFYGKQEFIRYFMKSLALTKSDVIILDRETGIGQVIFEEAQAARLGIVVHAEHYSEHATDEDYILWNNYYDYQFTNADKVDFFIVATDRQKVVLEDQFKTYSQHQPKIYTIPVGSLDKLIKPEKHRKAYAMMTASRLATEKHIDWLVRAVIQARKTLPHLTFDIYGSGGTEGHLREIIKEAGAEDYIQLKGHADLTNIYSQYEVYLTASTSEGFGLTLMEAVGSGLPLIGFDVPYGNQTFIQDGKNGYLIPQMVKHVEKAICQAFADKICQIYTDGYLENKSQHSYELAEPYLTKNVEKLWQTVLEEVVND